MGIFSKIFGTYSDRELKRIMPIADKVISYEDEYRKLTDEELQNKTQEFKDRLAKGETLDDILPEAFATVREASTRVFGQTHFKVQIIGGIVLHQGRIAEMKTGEGKTLTATLPIYLNALSGKGVHLVTVNDYLAKYQGEMMGKLYSFLGLTTGIILHDLENNERKEAYACDITYGTNNELGFDYLRDNMVVYKEEMVLRGLNFAIVDEVDSILIDEARTPLIISGEGDKSTEMYKIADFFVKRLPSEDYVVDEKARSVILTEEGIKKVERYFNLENYGDTSNMELQHHINQALKANVLFKRDKDYMVKDGEVIIVDEFTGRLMEGRRYSEGLHQAIEAKENVEVLKESKTLATITFQNFFLLYDKLAGMTGTAQTEEEEFRSTYKLDVVVIPTNKPVVREDHPDMVYLSEKGKYEALAEEIEETYKTGQPVLVGTISVEKSEYLSEMLKKRRIPHQVLNAKYHEQEAEIVSHAGERGMVTIATNMAGRGTDIILGEGVKELGGLKILGTERHESRRIDNQLRGRAGRQGDPGESRFYLSLEDDLMRIFGGDALKNRVDKIGLGEQDAIESKLVSRTIQNAQKKVEGNNFDTRKTLLGYDNTMDQQRKTIYSQRREVMEKDDISEDMKGIINEAIVSSIDKFISGSDSEVDFSSLKLYMDNLLSVKDSITEEEISSMTKEQLINHYKEIADEKYKEKEAKYPDQIRELEKMVLLKVVDTKWMDHIDNMDHLKRGIGLRAYKQQDPVQAYQFEGTDMFNEMIETINEEATRFFLGIELHNEEEVEREQVIEPVSTNLDENPTTKKPVVRKEKKIGRNDPCPCGSGKKYKNCCGKN